METAYISLALGIVLLARVVSLRLAWIVPWFTVSILVRIIPSAFFLWHGYTYKTPGYVNYWFIAEASLLIALGLVAAEIYFLITRPIFRLGWIGTAVFGLAFAIAAAVAASTGPTPSREWSDLLVASTLRAKRLLLTFLAAGLAAVFWFYRRFEIPVASFVWPHAFIFLFYVASHAAGFWLIEAWGGRHLEGLNILMGVLWAACLLAWSWVFRKQPVWPTMPTAAELAEADRRAERLTRLVDQ